jgi:hypothetical protein
VLTDATIIRICQTINANCALLVDRNGNPIPMDRQTVKDIIHRMECEAALRSAKGKRAWIADMAKAIIATSMTHFRWHDSGDILSADHLRMIAEVCKLTPGVAHWLPTREYRMVQEVAFDGPLPSNLTVRLSAHMIGRTLEPAGGFVTSSVDAGAGWQCPATHNPAHAGKCLDCRACWSRDVGNIDYSKH